MSSSAPSAGQKVTNDPVEKQQPAYEAVGIVISDSLAAESQQQGGSFGSNNPRAAPSAQTSHGTTTNITDTSAARKLDPAHSKAERDTPQPYNEASELNASIIAAAQKDPGRGPTHAVTTTTTTKKTRERKDSSLDNNGNDNTAPAPTYVTAQKIAGHDTKPKGTNLKEGEGFDGTERNTS